MRWTRWTTAVVLLGAVLVCRGHAGAQQAVRFSFDPTPLVVVPGQTAVVSMVVEPRGNPLHLVTASLNYDPQMVEVVELTGTDVLPLRVALDAYPERGHIEYAAFRSTSQPPITTPFVALTVRVRLIGGASESALAFVLSEPPRMTYAASGAVSYPVEVVHGRIVRGQVAATPTPAPTPTRAPAPACCGDCDGDGRVTASEITRCQSIRAGASGWSTCPACDCDGDGRVTDAELVRAIEHAQLGCPVGDLPPVAGERWSVHPAGTEAVIHGRVVCMTDPARACVQLPVHAAAPTPAPGDVWIQGGTRQLCFADQVGTRCIP